jgi:hypothetical protein
VDGGGEGKQQRLDFDSADYQALPGDRRPQHREVEGALAEPLALVGGEQIAVDLEGDLRELPTEGPRYERQLGEGRRSGEAEPSQSFASGRDPTDARGALVHGAKHTTCLFEQELAGRGEAHLAGGSGEQRSSELSFQLPYRLGQGGLCHVQPIRGPAEVASVGDGGEVAQMPQFHRGSSSFLPAGGLIHVSSQY